MRRRERFRDPEIGHHRGVPGEQDILRLDVPVDDTAPVRALEREGDVAEDRHRFGERDRSAREADTQVFAVHVWHGVVRHAVRFASAEDSDDARILQIGCHADLTLESLGRQSGRELGIEHLDDDLTAESSLFRLEHACHAAARQFALERVGRAEGRLEVVAQLHVCLQRQTTRAIIRDARCADKSVPTGA